MNSSFYSPFTDEGSSISLLQMLTELVNIRSYSELLSKFGVKSFQEYVSKGITHSIFYGDLQNTGGSKAQRI